MFDSIKQFCDKRANEFQYISEERKVILTELAEAIKADKLKKGASQLIYICTHNSRRSHLAQIFATVAAHYYNVSDIYNFSGGTEATALFENIVYTLQKIGFDIHKTGDDFNPDFFIRFGNHLCLTCFSKAFDDKNNPQRDFIAVMTCSDAEQNCPFIPTATKRINVKYNDPKVSDNTDHWEEIYMERASEICREMLFTFSLLKL